jgi:hypothetical protein
MEKAAMRPCWPGCAKTSRTAAISENNRRSMKITKMPLSKRRFCIDVDIVKRDESIMV